MNKLHSDVKIGDSVIASGKLMRVTDVVHEFAGYKLPKPVLEARIINPQTLKDNQIQSLGNRWEFSAIHDDLSFKSRA